jgi:hypothetical protein
MVRMLNFDLAAAASQLKDKQSLKLVLKNKKIVIAIA